MGFRLFFERQLESRYTKFVDRLAKISKRRSLVFNSVGVVGQGKYDIYLVTVNPKANRTICAIGTMHGNETAGVEALLDYLENIQFNKNVRLLIFPLLNPYGYVNNIRINGENRDINRSFAKEGTEEARVFKEVFERERIDFLVSMHENNSADGFYCFHSEEKAAKYKPLIKLAEEFFPILDQKSLYGDKVENGLIWCPKNSKLVQHRNSLENWVQKHGTNFICTETPAKYPLKKRINCQKAILKYVVDQAEDFLK